MQSILPILHEPTLQKDLEAVYAGSNDPYQNFVVRMVIAISLQKVDAQYAGLADSYYLAALQYLESNIRQMNLKTLQCCCLIGEYSLITPTRTAAYYIVGLAVRLLQSLGFTDERTISRMPDGGTADPLELDMRRRLFWNTWAMDLGLAHILGRPSALATSQEHIDVRFYNTADDRHITPEGIVPGRTLKKCLAIHFHKFRLLQLEIRRKLYLKKRDEPKDDRHPWFLQMEKRLSNWRDQSPEDDMGIGLDKIWYVQALSIPTTYVYPRAHENVVMMRPAISQFWMFSFMLMVWLPRFLGQYNTVIVMLYRPSPQIPRPSVEAVKKCFEACEFNVYMHRKQVEVKNVDLTWPFCSTVFQAINTILWSLSYVEIRRTHSRDKVEELLSISLDAMSLASQRWPGVASAHALYVRLMESCLKMYELDGDVPIMASSPEDGTSPESTHSQHRSRTDSPATISTTSIVTTPEDSSAAQRAYTLDSRLGLDSGISFDFPPPLHGLSSSVELDFGRLPTLAPLPSNPTLTAATGLPPAVPSSAPMASFSSPEAYESRTPRPSIPISPTAVSNSQPFRPVLEPDAESFLKPNPLPAFSSISSWDKPLRGGVDSFTSQNHMDHENPLPNARNYDVESEPYIDPCLDAHNPFSFVMDQYHGIGQAELSEQARSFSITGFQKAEKMIEESRNMFSCPPT